MALFLLDITTSLWIAASAVATVTSAAINSMSQINWKQQDDWVMKIVSEILFNKAIQMSTLSSITLLE